MPTEFHLKALNRRSRRDENEACEVLARRLPHRRVQEFGTLRRARRHDNSRSFFPQQIG